MIGVDARYFIYSFVEKLWYNCYRCERIAAHCQTLQQSPMLALACDDLKGELSREKQLQKRTWANKAGSSTAPQHVLIPKPKPRSRLPPLDISHLHVTISHVSYKIKKKKNVT